MSIHNHEEQPVTIVSSLSITDETTTEELLADLRHQLDVYINDVIVADAQPFWLQRQTWKNGGEAFHPAEYAVEFLVWLDANFRARCELAPLGQEPVGDMPIAQMATILADRLLGDERVEDDLAAMTRGEILRGYMLLGVAIAVHKDALHDGEATPFGSYPGHP